MSTTTTSSNSPRTDPSAWDKLASSFFTIIVSEMRATDGSAAMWGAGWEAAAVSWRACGSGANGRRAILRPSGTLLPHFAANFDGVLVEQFPGVNAVPGKGTAPEMMDEQVACDRELEAGTARSFGEVVVVEETEPELFVESADRFVHGPFHQDAEAGELAYPRPLAAVLVSPLPGEEVQLGKIAVGDFFDQLRRGCIV